jgi:RNA polymerase sigma-70 factor, ECF subfamily
MNETWDIIDAERLTGVAFPLKPDRSFSMAPQESLADLMARCALHDRRAFEALYQQASPTLYGLLVRLVRDRELAADLLQEGFVRVWQRAGDYRPALGQPLTWMGTIVRHLAIDRLRRVDHRQRGELDDAGWEQLAEAGPGPEEQLHTDHENVAITRCLETLDPEPRQAVLLAYYEGLTHDVIARRMERPLGTVKAWVRRSLQRLKTCLGES